MCLRRFSTQDEDKNHCKVLSFWIFFLQNKSAYYTLNCTISAFNGTLVQKFQKETRFKQWCPISLGDVHAHCFLYCSHLFVWTVHTFWASIRVVFSFSLQFSFCKFRAKLSTHFRYWVNSILKIHSTYTVACTLRHNWVTKQCGYHGW